MNACTGRCRNLADPRMVDVINVDSSPKLTGTRAGRRYCLQCRVSFKFKDAASAPRQCVCCGTVCRTVPRNNHRRAARKVVRI